MLRIAALNADISDEDSSSADGDVTSKELEEEEFVSLYTSALQLQLRGDVHSAKSAYSELLHLLNEHLTTNGHDLTDSIRVLQYSSYKNLGSICYEMRDWTQAAECLINASELDSADVTLWLRLGKVGLELGNLPLARSAFCDGLLCSPMNWPCLDHLMLVSFALYDYLACLGYVAEGLMRDPCYVRAIILRDQIFDEEPTLKEDVRALLNNYEPLLEPERYQGDAIKSVLEEVRVMRSKRPVLKPPAFEPVALKGSFREHTWTNFGQCLLATHSFVTSQDPPISTFVPVNLSSYEIASVSDTVPEVVQVVAADLEEAAKSSTEDGEVLLDDARRGSKRKRGTDELSGTKDAREQKRRSTRSRGGLFRLGEDIDSLRAELRSYLPTSLLVDASEANEEGKRNLPAEEKDEEVWFRPEEKKGNEALEVESFIEDLGNDQDILTILEKFCAQVVSQDRLDAELLSLFSSCFEVVRASIDYLHLKWEDELESREALALKVEILCVYVEVVVGRSSDIPFPAHLPQDFMTLIDACMDQALLSPQKSCELRCRVFWARQKYFLSLQETDAALYCLQMVDETLQRNSVRGFLAVTDQGRRWVTCSRVKQELESAERILHLQQVPALHAAGQTDILIGLLQASLSVNSSNAVGRAGHIIMLMEALCDVEQWPDVLIWGARCLKEATAMFVKLIEGADDEKRTSSEQEWRNCVVLILQKMQDVLRTNSGSLDALEQTALADLAESLILLAAQQLDSEDYDVLPTLKPWILLYQVLAIEERRRPVVADDSAELLELPGSLSFLTAVHDLLGRRGWCSKEKGTLLITIIREFLHYTKTSLSDPNSPAMRAIEQASYCLTGFPAKKNKNRALDEHNCNQVALSWDLSLLLCEAFTPSPLPQFDSLSAISSELEVLLKRVIEFMPGDFDPSSFLHVVEDYLNESASSEPWEAFSVPVPIRDIYYLLADFYFKSKEWSRAVTHYCLDLLVNPRRFDSWAALALTKGTQLETLINSCRSVNIESFLKQARSTLVCYKEAMTLKPEHISVCIEYGCLAYTLQAFASRYMRLHTNSLSVDLFSKLLKHKDGMLELAHRCFIQAEHVWSDSSDDQDERWLHQYMLGKIAEKRNGTPEESLSHYLRAGELLKEAGAEYPDKISYNNPVNYAVEALEIHYRIHCSVLKVALELESEKSETTVLAMLNSFLEKAVALFQTKPQNVDEEKEKTIPATDSAGVLNDIIILMDEIVGRVVAECEGTAHSTDTAAVLESPQDSSAPQTPEKRLEVSDIIKKCLDGIKDCVRRFPQHYKSLYRLSHYYFSSLSNKNVEASREVLLERRLPIQISDMTHQAFEYLPKGVTGLFRDWRLSNFFNGIWRIPVNEIDRPGSFAAHMGRCIALLVDILKESKDYRLLLELTLALYPEPEADRKYIMDFEREQVTDHAFTLMIQCLRERLEELKASQSLKNTYGPSPTQNRALSLLMEMYRIYQRVERSMPGKESSVAAVLQEFYALCRQNESKESTLQEVLQFCQAKHQADRRSARGTVTGTGRGRRPGTTNKRDSLTLSGPAKKPTPPIPSSTPVAPRSSTKPPKAGSSLPENSFMTQNSMSSLLYMNTLLQAAAANPLYSMGYMGFPVMGAGGLLGPEALDPSKMAELQAEYQRQWLQMMSPGFDLRNYDPSKQRASTADTTASSGRKLGSSKGTSQPRGDKDLSATPTTSKQMHRSSSATISNLSNTKQASSYTAAAAAVTATGLPTLPKGVSIDLLPKEWKQPHVNDVRSERQEERRTSLSLSKKPATVQQLLKDKRHKPETAFPDLREMEIQNIIGQQMVEQRYRKYAEKAAQQGRLDRESPYSTSSLPALNLSAKRPSEESSHSKLRLSSSHKTLTLSDEIEIQPVPKKKEPSSQAPSKPKEDTQIITID